MDGHDVEALVALFTEEDSGPTIYADRFAWQKFEIRQWAQRQVMSNVRVETFDYRLTEYGAAWEANVYRDDWRAAGVGPLSVTNSIHVHHGKLATFTSNARNPREAEGLGDLWRPGAPLDRPTF